jgi:protoporphyrinogen oxidase
MTLPPENTNEIPQRRKKVVVIGAGPAGLAAAYKLRASGVDVELYEAQGHVGGLCRSFEIWGHIVDLGPHRFFSSSAEVNQFWFKAVGEEFSWVPRQTRIFYQKKYFQYPLQAWDTFTQLGFAESLRSLSSYLWAKLTFRQNDETFENWVVARFGRRLYGIFFKTYSEKLWGLPCNEIDPDFAFRKIRGLSLLQVFKRFFKKKSTFVDQFAYPQNGTGSVYQTIAERFVKMGGVLKLNSPVQSLHGLAGDVVVSTMPLPLLLRMLPDVPQQVMAAAQDLSFRNTVLVYVWVEKKNLFPDNWIYVHSPDVQFGRVTNFDNWSSQKNSAAKGTVLCLEYWCSDDSADWQRTEEQWIALAQKELLASQIASDYGKILDCKAIKVPRSYPVFKKGFQKNVEIIRKYLQQAHPEIYSIGRYGAFKYNNQDHSLLMGLRAAEFIVKRHHSHLEDTSLEKINSSHTYEEDFDLRDIRYDTFDEV